MATVSKWGTEKSLDVLISKSTGFAKLTALADGRFAFVFGVTDSSLKQDVVSQVVNADGTLSASGVVPLHPTSSGMQTWAAISATATGGFVSAWTGDVFGEPTWIARAGADGKVIGSYFKAPIDPFDPDNPAFFADQSDPVVTVLTDGTFVVAWTDASWNYENSSITVVQRYSAAGAALGTFVVSDDGAAGTSYANDTSGAAIEALTNGNYVVTWTQEKNAGTNVWDIYGQVYTATGTTVGSEFTANTSTDGNAPLDGQSDSAVTELASGAFVVAWSDSHTDTVKLQRFTSLGAKSGGELTVTLASGHSASSPELATLKDGRFIVIWTDSTGTSPNYDSTVRAMIYKADGTVSVTPFQVNTQTDGQASSGSVSVLADGRIVIGYAIADSDTDSSVAGNHNGTYWQIFDPRNAAVTVNGTTLNDQFHGTIFGDTLNGLTGSDSLNGGAGGDTLNAGNDTVVDTLSGNTGNDIYIVKSNDIIKETAGDAADKVKALQSFALATDDHIELMETANAAGTEAINLTGNNLLGQTITGNAGANTLSGLGGADVLKGGGGLDVLIGGIGGDTLNGGDTLKDTFRYFAPGEGGDIIQNFDAADVFSFEGSAFGLGAYAGPLQGFRFISKQNDNLATTNDQRFIFNQVNDQLWFDSNGSAGGGTKVLIADLSNNINLTAADIVIF